MKDLHHWWSFSVQSSVPLTMTVSLPTEDFADCTVFTHLPHTCSKIYTVEGKEVLLES